MKNRAEHYFDSIAALFLCVVFAAGIISVIFAGAGAYTRLSERYDIVQNERIAQRYISTKVHSAKAADSLSVVKIGESDALCISESIDGTEYATYIWCSDGWIKETFTNCFASVNINAGEKLLQADKISFSLENDLLRTEVTIDGHETYAYIDIRGGVK